MFLGMHGFRGNEKQPYIQTHFIFTTTVSTQFVIKILIQNINLFVRICIGQA